MSLRILTADEVKASISRHRRVITKEEREFIKKRDDLSAAHDLRDDVCSIILNSGKTPEMIRAEGGPTVKTINNWLAKKVSCPQMGKMRATLIICGYNLAIVDREGKVLLTSRGR